MGNSFEIGTQKVIPAVLVYPEKENQILMLHRNAKQNDYHQGKWNGLGGKCELGESPLDAAIREVKEEAGLDLSASAFKPLGVIQFPNFKPQKNEDWFVFVFTAYVSTLSQHWSNGPEGELHWIEKSKLLELNIWAGDRYFLPYVIQGNPFIGTIWYQGEQVMKHWIQPLLQKES